MKTMNNDAEVYASKKFGIPIEEIVFYNSGICYNRIVVKTRESAEKVRAKVAGEYVNGGMLDGMPLGSISESLDHNGVMAFSIYC